MARKVTVVLEDDLCGGPAERTVGFALDGIGYEIDLSEQNAAEFHDQLAPFIAHARTAGRRGQARTVSSRRRSASIRAWAQEHGISVHQRGSIPAGVIEQYQRATRNQGR
jgi:Lsr2